LHTLKDATDRAGYTCCADYDAPPPASSPAAPLFHPNRYASDRVALSCQSCKDVSVVGGASAPGGTCAAIFPSFEAGYPCNASKEEHCPVLTRFTWQPTQVNASPRSHRALVATRACSASLAAAMFRRPASATAA
jgi:hypothetical protein